jgi:lipopolysaccharide export LptBFGC system permease protein LptF
MHNPVGKPVGLNKVKLDFRFPPTLTKHGLFPFVFSFFIVLTLISTQFLLKYSADMFGKGLYCSTIAQLIILEIGNILLIALPFPTIIAGVFLYRKLFREKKHLLKAFRHDIIVMGSFSFLVWMFAAFIQPNINLEFMSLLYDIRKTAPQEEIKRTDLSLFNGHTTTESIVGLMLLNDSLNNKLENSKERLRKTLRTYAPPERLDSLLATIDLTKSDLTKNEIKNDKAVWDGYNYPTKSLTTRITSAEREIGNFKREINRNNQKIWQMFFIPLALLLLFILSTQLGILNHQTNLIIVIGSLIFFVIPAWYCLTFFVEKLIKTEIISVGLGKLGLLIVLLICNFGLYLKTRKELERGQEFI